MIQPPLTIEHADGIATLRMNRPPANALDLDFTRAAAKLLAELASDPPKALIITGSGDFFSGGLDLKSVPAYSKTEQREMVLALSELVGALYGFTTPTVAAINGHAVAAGTLLALCCDHRVAAEGNLKFGLTGTKVGIPYPAAAQAVIQAELAPHIVRRMLLTAGVYDVSEALDMGIVDDICPAEKVEETAREIAAHLATFPRETYRSVKQRLRSTPLDIIRRALEGEDPFLDKWIHLT